MKILHTADWHLGNTFHAHSRLNEHKHFLKWLLGVLKERQPDALLITGDVFDSPNPSAQAEELLYDFMLRATLIVPGLQIVVTAGNHDSAGRLEAPAPLLKTHNIYVRGTMHYAPQGEPDFDYYLLPLAERATGQAACVCMAVPYLRSADYPMGMSAEQGLRYVFGELHKHLRQSEFRGLPVVVGAHFYAAGAEVCQSDHSERLVVGGQDCVNADVVGTNVSYTALGHIHKAQPVGKSGKAWYAGSALPMSFAEAHYSHGVQWVEIDHQGEAVVERIKYEPLRRLITIPANARAVSAAEAMQQIAALPKRVKGDMGETWPYLELRIEEKQPEPTLMHDVMEALADRAVHFCRIQRVMPATNAAGKADKQDAPSADALTAMQPLDLARRYFESRYNEPMPEPLVTRFEQACREGEPQA